MGLARSFLDGPAWLETFIDHSSVIVLISTYSLYVCVCVCVWCLGCSMWQAALCLRAFHTLSSVSLFCLVALRVAGCSLSLPMQSKLQPALATLILYKCPSRCRLSDVAVGVGPMGKCAQCAALGRLNYWSTLGDVHANWPSATTCNTVVAAANLRLSAHSQAHPIVADRLS